MCIVAWLWQDHSLYPLILLHNRDEFHDRPTDPVAWWGKGIEKKGWLMRRNMVGLHQDGRLAFLTNVLEPDVLPCARTRGDLPLRFLQGGMSPLEFAEELKEEANEYNGFNLIVADIPAKLMVYVSNRPKGEPITIQMVSPGLHVLSNAKLDTSWHKAQHLRAGFINLNLNYGEEEVIHPEDMIEKLMRDTTKADRESLPNTGCDLDWELNLSSIFVEVKTKLGLYGTRSSVALTVKADGNVSFYEKYLEKGVWKEHIVAYDIEKIY